MDAETSRQQAMRENAEAFVNFARERLGVDLGFDRDGVEWLDGFLERRRSGLMPAQVDDLVMTAGAYLGECLRCTYGGAWEGHEGCSVVRFAGGAAAFPFTKTRKHIESGAGDSVLGLFDVIPEFLGPGGVPPNPRPQRTRPAEDDSSSS